MRYLLLSLLFSFSLFAQKADYKPMKINGCKLWKSEDPFEKVTTVRTDMLTASKVKGSSGYGKGSLSVMFFKATGENDKLTYMAMFSGLLEGCRDERAYVDLLFANGEKRKYQHHSNAIKCGTTAISVDLTAEDVEYIKANPISKVRLQYIDNRDDFDVSEKGVEVITASLTCLSSN